MSLVKCLVALILLITVPSYGAITVTGGEWSTTYSCDEWTSYSQYGGAEITGCDGVERNGGQQCEQEGTDKYEEIISDANYSSGGGGKGQRHYTAFYGGIDPDTGENYSGGTKVDWSVSATTVTEFWFRFYIRFDDELTFNSDELGSMAAKVINVYNSLDTKSFVNIPAGADDLRLRKEYAPAESFECSDCGWQTSGFGEGAPNYEGSNTWHYVEVHFKRESASESEDGEFHLWVDGGSPKILDTSVDWGLNPGEYFDYIILGSTVHAMDNAACAGFDFDDLAFSTNGYIGPVSDSGGNTTIGAGTTMTIGQGVPMIIK